MVSQLFPTRWQIGNRNPEDKKTMFLKLQERIQKVVSETVYFDEDLRKYILNPFSDSSFHDQILHR